LLDILPEEIGKSGKGREYFEKSMLSNWFPDIAGDQKVLVCSLTKAVLDRSFSNSGVKIQYFSGQNTGFTVFIYHNGIVNL
jgi:hypothetical protein